MNVEPIIGEMFRFHVASSHEGHEPYLVDIAENDCRGECGCPHWQCRLARRVMGGERVFCKHVIAARDFFLDQILPTLVAEERQKNAPRSALK